MNGRRLKRCLLFNCDNFRKNGSRAASLKFREAAGPVGHLSTYRPTVHIKVLKSTSSFVPTVEGKDIRCRNVLMLC